MSGIALTTPPENNEYSYVLTKDKWNPAMKQVVPTYRECLHSYNIVHADGVARTTLFVRTRDAFNALRMRGWIDRTNEWLTKNSKPEVPVSESIDASAVKPAKKTRKTTRRTRRK